MWTSTLELKPARVIPTKILGSFWRGAYFSSFAPLQVQNLPRYPLPASNWVRVRNSLAGICGSDLHLIFVDGDFSIAPAALPGQDGRTYPGHEVVGEVIEVGEDVQTLHVGDHVVLQHGPNCLTAGIQPPCRSCAAGSYGLCESGGPSRTPPIGGGWSEEMLLHEQQLFRIPPGISDAQAVLLEPTAVAVHAVLRHLPRSGDRVLIIGAGTIGQLILQVVRALAPGAEVNVLARHAFQVERAASMGARIIYPEDSYEGVQSATGAQLYQGMFGNKMLLGGCDVIYDAVGSKRTTHDALRWARAGSTVVMVGVNLHRMHIDLTPIWYQELNLIGALASGIETWPIGTSEKKSTFEIAVELIESGQIHPDKLITHTFLLSEYRTALMTARNKTRHRVMKVVFDFSKQPPSVVPNVRASSRQHLLTTGGAQNTGEPSAFAPYTNDFEENAEDVRTVVVSPSKHARFDTAFPPGPALSFDSLDSAPQPIGEGDENTTTSAADKQAYYDMTSQYGSLPGFHQDLEELGMALKQDDDDTRKVASVSLPHYIQNTPHVTPDEDNTEAPFLAPAAMDTDSDYSWTQFISPQDTGEDNVETSLVPPPSAISDNAETSLPMTQNTGEIDDDPKTVFVSPAKRPRSRRGTGSNQAPFNEENKHFLPANSLNQEEREGDLQEAEQGSNVTKDPPNALVE